MSASYFKAAIPEPYRILGLPLLPLSLGRYRILKRFDCGFVADGETRAGMADLIIGVVVCSMRCDEFLAWADSPSFAKDIADWSARLAPTPWLGRLPILGKLRRRRPDYSFNVVEKLSLFQNYISESSTLPRYWYTESADSGAGQHWAQACETTLRSELGWTEEEINERPITKAIGDYFSMAESRGQIRIMTPEEVAYIDQLEKAAQTTQPPAPAEMGRAENGS
jgi:hypothetical protein